MSRISSRTARLAVTAGLVTALAIGGGSATALAEVAKAETPATSSAPATDQAPESPEAPSATTEPAATPSAPEQSKPSAPETDAKPDASTDAQETGAFTANGKSYDTFADAVAAASKAKDKTVTVNASTTEDLTVAKDNVTVTAAEGVELRGTLDVKAKNVTVTGIHFVLDDQSTATDSVAAGNGTTVTNCVFDITGTRDGQLNAIRAAYVSDLDFEDNTFNIAVNVQNNSWVGINLVGKGVENVKIINNTLNGLTPVNDTWNADGKAPNLYLVIANGNVPEGGYGIENLTATGNKTFDKTGVDQPNTLVYGISFNNVNGATLSDNAFEGYMGFAYTGYGTQAPSKDVTISNNKLDTRVGIRLREQDVEKGELKLKDNTFGENTQTKYDTAYSVADQDGTTYESLDEALKAKATKVTLLSDERLDDPLTIDHKVTLDGKGFGINGKLILADGATGSTIENTHFIQNGSDNYGFASSLQLSGASNVTITNNTFSMDEDTYIPGSSARAVAVYVMPSNGKVVANTTISNNTFDITNNKVATNYHYAIFLTNEGNDDSHSESGVVNTTISGNTMGGQKEDDQPANQKRVAFLGTYDSTKKGTRQGVDGVKITDNNLMADGVATEDTKPSVLIDFMGGTKNVTIEGNKFGAAWYGIKLRALAWGNKKATPSDGITIKGNEFKTGTAVANDNGKDDGIENDENLHYEEFQGTDNDNTFEGAIPFFTYRVESRVFGVRYSSDGKMIGWETVTKDGALNKVPSKEGYTTALYKDGKFKTPFDSANKVTEQPDLLYVKWEPIEYTIKYDLDGGTNADANPTTYTVESDIALAAPTRPGYTFTGWVDDNGNAVTKIEKGSTGNLTLHAKWQKDSTGGGTVTPTPKTYTVTFVDNVSYTTDQTAKVTSGQKVTKPADPTLEGYVFKGWFTDAGLKQAYDFSKPVAGDLTLFAKWSLSTTEPGVFSDVDANAWYAPGVGFVSSHGLMGGYSNADGSPTGEFGVGKQLTRGELAVILARFAAPGYGPEDFRDAKNETGLPDVADGQFYTWAANWAVENGVINGYDNPDGSRTFGPNDPVTMEQMVTIIANLVDKDGAAKADVSVLDKFRDPASVTPWATKSVAWAVEKGLINGSVEGDGLYLHATDNIMRERVATVLMNAFQRGILSFE